MSYRKEDLANILFGGIIVEGHITHLNELDPTHVVVQPASVSVSNPSQATPACRTTLPSCVLTEMTTAAVLFELDPTHVHVR